jgi:hypothetical protein
MKLGAAAGARRRCNGNTLARRRLTREKQHLPFSEKNFNYPNGPWCYHLSQPALRPTLEAGR